MGLWSRFWSVVPKAVVKSGRDAFTRETDPTSAPETASAEESLADASAGDAEVADVTKITSTDAESGASGSADAATVEGSDDDASTQPRKRTL